MYRYSWLVTKFPTVTFGVFGATGNGQRAQVCVRGDETNPLSVTPRLMLLMRLDLFFAGVPNLPPLAKAFIPRGGGERALLPRASFSCL